MSESDSAGARFRAALAAERPLQLPGTPNAFCARLAEDVGFRAAYLSGAGVANISCGLPDLGMITPQDVLQDAERITAVSRLPLLVDADTGWGGPLLITRGIRSLSRAGVAGIHIEDQVGPKRCGHRPGKMLVEPEEMVGRIHAAVDARDDAAFVIMARTDAKTVEGVAPAIDRACRYVEAGADMIFAEAFDDLAAYRRLAEACGAPVLANLTEFGHTPLFSIDELRDAGVAIVLYPLTAFRAMAAAALRTYRTLREEGTQKRLVPEMQAREELYRVLDYHSYEQRIDQLARKVGDHGHNT